MRKFNFNRISGFLPNRWRWHVVKSKGRKPCGGEGCVGSPAGWEFQLDYWMKYGDSIPLEWMTREAVEKLNATTNLRRIPEKHVTTLLNSPRGLAEMTGTRIEGLYEPPKKKTGKK